MRPWYSRVAGPQSGHALLAAYDRLVQNVFLVYQYHFEMLVLAYAAQLNFQDFCRATLSGITAQSLSALMAGVDLLQYRPDDELKRLARLAVELGVGAQIREDRPYDPSISAPREDESGRAWLAALDGAKDRGSTSRRGPASFTQSAPGSTTSRCRGRRSAATSSARARRGDRAPTQRAARRTRPAHR